MGYTSIRYADFVCGGCIFGFLRVVVWFYCRLYLCSGSEGWLWGVVCLWGVLVWFRFYIRVNCMFKYVNFLEKCWVLRGWEV